MKFGCHHCGLFGALMLLVSCGKSDPAKSARADSTPRSVQVARAELRPMERALQVVGTLAARDETTISAQVAGQIEKQSVDLGDRVTAGQELTLIDTTSYEALVQQTTANVARAAATAASAEQNLKRIQELQKDKVASSSELDEAIARAGQGRADVKAAEAANAIARLNLERSRVKAPFDGAVAQRIASVGDYVAIGAPIFRLVNINPLRLRLEIPERESTVARVGQNVRVTAEGVTNVYSGKIARVAPAIRETDRMLEVEADVPNPGDLRAGLFARAQIIVNERDETLSVPTNALTIFAGIEKVVSIKDGKATEKTVSTGRRSDGWVEIVSGLSAGETVALDPAGLRTGQGVTITSANSSAGDSKNGGAR